VNLYELFLGECVLDRHVIVPVLIVVPRLFVGVAQHKVHHLGCGGNIYATSPPIAVVRQLQRLLLQVMIVVKCDSGVEGNGGQDSIHLKFAGKLPINHRDGYLMIRNWERRLVHR